VSQRQSHNSRITLGRICLHPLVTHT
jgi:hypothetical protein